jgi:hypothetical protein
VCPAGSTGPDGGTCTACVAGKFKSGTGSVVCTECGASTYSTSTGATAIGTCQSCPTNSQSTPGSDAATDCVCVVGFSGPDGGACAACVAGKYKANPGSADCTACLANSNHALTGRTAASACQCNAGTRVGVACACPLCPACLAMIRPALSCFVPRQSRSAYFRRPGHDRSHAPPRARLHALGPGALAGATRTGSKLRRWVQRAQQLHGHGDSQCLGQQGR